jgi:chromate transporter
MKKIIKFIYVFLIIGFESLGNMSAVSAVLEENLIKKNKWITEEDLIDSITISRLGPGATTANMVAFLGNKIAGVGGGILATICYTILPMIIILCSINVLDKMVGYSVVMSALKGSLACIFAMFVKSTWEMGKSILKCKLNKFVFGIALLCIFCAKISGVWIILASVILGIIIVNKK